MPSKGIRASRDGATPFAFEELTVSGAVIPLAQLPGLGEGVLVGGWIEVESQPIRIRVDSGAPTSSVGHLYNPGQSDYLNAQELRALRAIRTTASDGLLRVTYYRD